MRAPPSLNRGLLLSGDMPPGQARPLWGLLWSLGLLQGGGAAACQVPWPVRRTRARTASALPVAQDGTPSPCSHPSHKHDAQIRSTLSVLPAHAQVLTHIVHMPLAAAMGAASAAGPPVPRAFARASDSGGAAGGLGGGEPASSPGRSLLVVASALTWTLAVVLTSYDEEIEEELAGASVGWLVRWLRGLLSFGPLPTPPSRPTALHSPSSNPSPSVPTQLLQGL
jgi:hypothetical protein